MKPAKIRRISISASCVSGSGSDRQTCGAADEAHDLQPDTAEFINKKNGADDADDQQQVDEAGSLGGQDVVVDEIGQASHVLGLVADRSGKDRWRKDADAIGAEVLKKPRNGGKDCGPPCWSC